MNTIPFSWVTLSLHGLHDALFGPSSSDNPWIDHLRHIYDDADHLWGLLGFLVPLFTILSIALIVPLYSYTAASSSRTHSRFTQIAVSATLLFVAVYMYEEQWEADVVAVTSNQEAGGALQHGPGLTDLITGNEPRLKLLLEKCPILRRGPRPPIWFSNRHVQFIPWMIQNTLHTRPGIKFQRLEFVVTDCLDKATPNCTADDSMNDTITLDVFPPWNNTEFGRSAPVILFSPGLRCHSQDLPGNSILRAVYGKGFRSIVVNRRGHTPGRLLQAPRWNLFGDVDDLEQVYWHVKNNLVDPNTPLFLHGISSGSGLVVSALGAWDKRSKLHPHLASPTFVGAVLLSPGYDVSKVLQPNRFKWPYNPLLTSQVKDHFLEQNKQILVDFNATAYESALAATSLQELVDASAVFAGYPTSESYYAHTNPVNEMQWISTPIYVLNSNDDPCCDIQNLYETSQQPQHEGKSYADIVDTSDRGIVAVAKTGSHCPFLDGRFFPFLADPLGGGVMLNSWADQSITEFYVAALEVYNDRRLF